MLSDNVKIRAVNKYTTILGDNNHIIQYQYCKLIRPLAISQHGSNQYAHLQAWRQYKYCPEKCKPMHPIATLAMSILTPSRSCNAESVNTHINIRLVAILEELIVLWQLIHAETVDTITIIVFRNI